VRLFYLLNCLNEAHLSWLDSGVRARSSAGSSTLPSTGCRISIEEIWNGSLINAAPRSDRLWLPGGWNVAGATATTLSSAMTTENDTGSVAVTRKSSNCSQANGQLRCSRACRRQCPHRRSWRRLYNQVQNVGSLSAERHAHADFASSARDEVGKNAVKTCQGQTRDPARQHTEERDEEARLCGPETQDRFNGYRTV